MTKQIALFNHKGGVSKTTTTFNLGWMLADKGKRVMIVDCDPQCNLTDMDLRNQIAHEADLDLRKPWNRWRISPSDTERIIIFLQDVGEVIYRVVDENV